MTWRWWGSVAVVLALASCGEGTEVSTAVTATPTNLPTPTRPQPAPLADDDLVHPLLAVLTAEIRDRPAGAIGIEVTNDCLAEAGFDLPDAEDTGGDIGQPLSRGGRLAYRLEHGYGYHHESDAEVAATDALRVAFDARDAFEAGLGGSERDRFLLAWYGPNGPADEGETTEGCLGEGETAIRALAHDVRLPDGLHEEMSRRLEDGYAALDETGYLGCVHDAGFTDVTSIDELSFRVHHGETSAEEELEIARVDAECGDLHLRPHIAALEREVLAWLEAELAGS